MEQIILVQKKLLSLVEFVKPFLPFLNSHMVSFLTDNYWMKFVPNDVRIEIENMGHEAFMTLFHDIYSGTQFNSGYKNTINFLKSTNSLQLLDGDVCPTLSDLCLKLNINKYYLPLEGLQKIMSDKKTHEVNIVSAITNFLCRNSESSLTVVDIGGGKGYLSSLLAMEYKLKVIGVDSNQTNTHGAAKRDLKLKKHWQGITSKLSRHLNDMAISNSSQDELYKLITQYVDESTNLKELVKQSYPNDKFSGICMTGLHTCGNLASSSLRIYSSNNDVKSILNVGCCYHLLDEQYDDTDSTSNNYGFPMSNLLHMDKFALGRNARMLASQSIDRKVHLKENLNKSLLYRAVLELLIHKHCDKNLDVHVGRIGAKCKTFSEYVNTVSERKNLGLKFSDELLEDLIKNHEENWLKLQSYHALKMCFAPILELIIVLDRYLYLLENGYNNTYLIKLFDPVISPRCYALISVK